MPAKDIRWIQRYHNFNKAFAQLKEAVVLTEQRKLSRLEEQGLIQAFEYTHELAWNTLKDFLEDRGVKNVYGSRDATREAFKIGLIENGETWMEMIDSRNQTTHTYNQETVAEIVSAVTHSYFAEFEELQTRMKKLKEESA
ncbi:MAG: nucleotidyltransferase substrate binding protein [Planctomycetota bacterium]